MKRLYPKQGMNPKDLIGREFLIPVLSAENQTYRCFSVEKADSKHYANETKHYVFDFSEVKYKRLDYSVPKRLRLHLYWFDHGDMNVQLCNEETDYVLAEKTLPKAGNINSLTHLELTLMELANISSYSKH